MALPETFVLIDVETTGANPVVDRVTEVAVLRVEGGRIVERWESLVNPQRPIPDLIQRLIGITDAMVATAPTFAELADTVRARLEGAVFVAHNARFDYGFIQNEFVRIGQTFEAPVLCTVKLSRALYPEHHRHGLDALIARHGLTCDARHRAMGDTDVLWQFLGQAQTTFSDEVLAAAVTRAMKLPARPPALPSGVLEGLPDAPGVYVFSGEDEVPLYIGRAGSLRGRVLEHFAPDRMKGKNKDASLARAVRQVTWHETAGEFGAALRELELVRARRPVHNRQLRDVDDIFALRLIAGRKRPPIFERVPIGGTDPAAWDGLYGTFHDSKEANALLRELAQQYQLCPRRLGLESGRNGACQAHQARRCAGVCAGKETLAAHDARLGGALGVVKLKAWPWNGPVVLSERNPHAEREAFHLLDQWCHLGSATSMDELAVLRAAAPTRRFDLDVYRLLVKWFAVEAHLADIGELPPAG